VVLTILLTARLLRMESTRQVIVPLIECELPELCNFRRIFGIDCPGCGMTRSFILASRLQYLDAWRMNPAGALLFVSLALSIPLRLWQWFRVRQGNAVRSTLKFEAGWLVVIVCVMMFRWMVVTIS
jgi:Protein of unknown function (DUF2752)